LEDFPDRDLRVFVEDEDPFLQAESKTPLGPNPKIRNMSRAYREAKGDIVWIIDCNIWVGRGVGGRMVDRLCGFSRNRNGNPRIGLPYKFVHHLPIALDVDGNERLKGERDTLLRENGFSAPISSILSDPFFKANETDQPNWAHILQKRGGRLEELFLSSSHAKMYTAINTVLIAPCIVGKSNMFRRSHLDYLTRSIPGRSNPRIAGIDYFSHNICEDHLIGDLLWKSQIREERELGEKWGKHALVFGDFAFQPMASMSVKSYIARRVRWLRVRKFTVLAATLVEPGTESLMCSLYGAFALKTAVASLLQDSYPRFSSGLSTWSAFFAFWFSSITVWAAVDWILYLKIHSGATVEIDPYTVPFVRQRSSALKRGTLEQNHWTIRRPFHHWLLAWLGREILAFPIWLWAIYGGTTVVWRDRTFKVSLNTRVTEVGTAPASLRPKADSDAPYDRSNPGSSSTSRSSSWKRSSENIISARDGRKVRRD
jgi:ceramide glucosyltransferase